MLQTIQCTLAALSLLLQEVQRALVAGNYELAVEACFKANRLADALLIANIFNRCVGECESTSCVWDVSVG